jgi:hypothetical protein
MLTTETVAKALDLLDLGYTYPDIEKETGIASDDARAVGHAYLVGQTEQLSGELQLAGVLELAAAKLRSGGLGRRHDSGRGERGSACLSRACEEGACASFAGGKILRPPGLQNLVLSKVKIASWTEA